MAFDLTALIWPVTILVSFLIVRNFMQDHAKISQKNLAAQDSKSMTSATKTDLELMRVKSMKELIHVREVLDSIRDQVANQTTEIGLIRSQVNTATKAATSAALAVGLNLDKMQ